MNYRVNQVLISKKPLYLYFTKDKKYTITRILKDRIYLKTDQGIEYLYKEDVKMYFTNTVKYIKQVPLP